MSTTPIRCTAPHPTVPGWECRARLVDAVPGTVQVEQGERPPPGCVLIVCSRCGARYVACARAA